MKNKLCLGTVKLGIPDYGFSSNNKTVNTEKFLADVRSLGVSSFDTAPVYGDSETILGQHINYSNKPAFISSKIDGLEENDHQSPQKMMDSVKRSLAKLNVERLDVCYLHQNEVNILSDSYITDGLQLLKEMNLIKYSGASVYSLKECELCLNLGVYDYMQVPISIFDAGFYNEFVKHNKSPVQFVARSILLQGMVVNRNKIISKINDGHDVNSYLRKIDLLADEYNIRTIDLALAFVFSLENISQYIIGTTSISSIKNAIECLDKKLPKCLIDEVLSMALVQRKWTNPRNWNN